MSEPRLRPTTAADLATLSRLTETVFGRRRAPELLCWLLLHTDEGLDLASRVAVDSGRVVGHVAVLRSRYRWRGRAATGSHPLLWMVAPEARGRAGLRLGRWCLSHGDFTLIVGGTPTSRKILGHRHFTVAGRAVELRLPTAAGSRPRARVGGTELLPYEPAAAAAGDETGPLVNLAAPAHLRWLAACPTLESRLYTLARAGAPLGPVLLYVNRRVDPPRGRIVHLPWAGAGWREPLRLALDELAAAGCRSASLLATDPGLLEAAAALGGEPFYERPVLYRQAPRPASPAAAWREPLWHLTYLEADLAYRRV